MCLWLHEARLCAFKLCLMFCNPLSSNHQIFLDDVQWADSASLGILLPILSDMMESSCAYLICSYRSNEVPVEHTMFKFMKDLEDCNVTVSKIHLESLEVEDVNHMISDTLGVFPRISMPLSQLVLRKTKVSEIYSH